VTFVPAAFVSPHGRALIAELGRALRADLRIQRQSRPISWSSAAVLLVK
jgi:hypothetical protein